MIELILALQAAAVTDTTAAMEPLSTVEASQLFKEVCFDPFPDPAAAIESIERSDRGLTKTVKAQSGMMQPGDSWTSPKAEVTYASADWLPRDLPSPQCSVTVVLAGNPNHLDVEQEFSTLMGLPAGKGGKNKPSAETRWDIAGKAPDSWRIFLSTDASPTGKQMRAAILNLRGKTKK